MNLDYSVLQNGDSALDIRFGAAPSEALSERIIALADAIEAARLPEVRELIPAYQCLTVCYDPLRLPVAPRDTETISSLKQRLSALIDNNLSHPARVAGERRLIRIPVCYEREFAPDMDALCAHTGLTANEVIARHTRPHYLVHMLGFTPGFLYLGGLDARLHTPRKGRPALQVPAGSVGIGGSQTGIYPQATPGGWQIIGRTPLCLFRPGDAEPFIARPLDRIEFVPISPQAFADWNPLATPEAGAISQSGTAEHAR
ncbi:5-oxoprolinase subunit PxpB [Microbulbifer sp. SA54]|uniref:5-oxoprolinase subunit PxpB n=1 Tax=Microbulbifer sp. SA54 TaxID=3401577 RepID=UPI003AB07352